MTPRERAQAGITLLKEAILEELARHPEGLGNSELATALDIHSDYLGDNRDYLSWSVLGLLLNEKRVAKESKKYSIPR